VVAADATAGIAFTAGASTFNANRGNIKLPPASSITFIWQIYIPGFNCASGTSY